MYMGNNTYKEKILLGCFFSNNLSLGKFSGKLRISEEVRIGELIKEDKIS